MHEVLRGAWGGLVEALLYAAVLQILLVGFLSEGRPCESVRRGGVFMMMKFDFLLDVCRGSKNTMTGLRAKLMLNTL